VKRKADKDLEVARLKAVLAEGLDAHDLQLWKKGSIQTGAKKVHRILAERGLL
jgi:hypothetical protein